MILRVVDQDPFIYDGTLSPILRREPESGLLNIHRTPGTVPSLDPGYVRVTTFGGLGAIRTSVTRTGFCGRCGKYVDLTSHGAQLWSVPLTGARPGGNLAPSLEEEPVR